MRELEELRAKAEELEKLKAKLKKRDQQIASLQEAISLKKLQIARLFVEMFRMNSIDWYPEMVRWWSSDPECSG